MLVLLTGLTVKYWSAPVSKNTFHIAIAWCVVAIFLTTASAFSVAFANYINAAIFAAMAGASAMISLRFNSLVKHNA